MCLHGIYQILCQAMPSSHAFILYTDENNSRNYFLQDLLEALNQLEQGLKDSIKKLSSFDKYKQEVLLGHLDWSPMHKDPIFWRENISCFEEHDFQVQLYSHFLEWRLLNFSYIYISKFLSFALHLLQWHTYSDELTWAQCSILIYFLST